MIQAILLAQWRSMRSFRLGTPSVASAVGWISRLLFYGFWSVLAFGAQAYLANPANRDAFVQSLPGALLFILAYWQITPVITASMGSSLDLRKLLVYPIPPYKLFAVELLLRLTVCLEMAILLIGVAVGLIRNPETGTPVHTLTILGATAFYLAFNVLLAAALRNLLERLLQHKRMKEVFMFLLLAITVVPQFLLAKRFRPEGLNWSLLPQAPYLPWSATAHLLLGSKLVASWFVAAVGLGAAYLFARSQFVRSLRFDGASDGIRRPKPTGKGTNWELLFRWPALLFPDPTAAIVEKELRSLLRIPQFRFVFIAGAAFGLVMYVPRIISSGQHPESFLDRNILALASVYGVLMLGNVSYFNCFGFERSAAQAWYSYPVPLRTAMVAKNLAAVSFIFVEIILVALITLVLRLHVTMQGFVESFAVALIAAAYMMAFGNLASVYMPHPLNPERVAQGGQSKAKNALILLAFPIILLPIVLAYWARSVFESSLVFGLLLVLAALLGGGLYSIGLDSAVTAGHRRREKIITELSRGDGPVAST